MATAFRAGLWVTFVGGIIMFNRRRPSPGTKRLRNQRLLGCSGAPSSLPLTASEDEDPGHSINEDLRMQGLRGDDESDLEADREELFGSFAAPIDVDDGGAAGGAAGAAAAAAAAKADDRTTAGDGKRKRPQTSEAWLDFEKIYEIMDVS
ncbi:hypothetical protein ACP4OV_001988 [Aristida adscensionis]